jgi:hypothetical protein
VVSLGLGVGLYDTSTHSVWPGAVDMMKVLPADVEDFSYVDLAMLPDRWWEKSGWWENFFGEDFLGQSLERVHNWGLCRTEYIQLYSGSLFTESYPESLGWHPEEYHYYEEYGAIHYQSGSGGLGMAIVNHIVIAGYEEDVRRCIDVAMGDEPSLYDDENFRGVLDRLPKGISLSLWSPESESESWPGVLVEGRSWTEDNGTQIETRVYCYGDGEYRVFASPP